MYRPTTSSVVQNENGFNDVPEHESVHFRKAQRRWKVSCTLHIIGGTCWTMYVTSSLNFDIFLDFKHVARWLRQCFISTVFLVRFSIVPNHWLVNLLILSGVESIISPDALCCTISNMSDKCFLLQMPFLKSLFPKILTKSCRFWFSFACANLHKICAFSVM